MAERLNFDPSQCLLNKKVRELGLPSCRGECIVTPSNPNPTCIYEAFDNVTIRYFKGGYRLKPEKDLLQIITDVPFTLFKKKGTTRHW